MKRRTALLSLLALGAACPHAARAQQPGRTWRVGLFLAGTETAVARQRAVIVERLAKHGFVEGRNRTWLANSSPCDRMPSSSTRRLALRMREATGTIPIVFTGVADPIGAGLVKDFARPGGNVTGIHFSQLELGAKRLELLRRAPAERPPRDGGAGARRT